jgi:phage/plasmid-associated DNA primase
MAVRILFFMILILRALYYIKRNHHRSIYYILQILEMIDYEQYIKIFISDDSNRESALINSSFDELDIVNYLMSYGEEYISAGGNLYRFNSIYWEVIGTERVFNTLAALYSKLETYIYQRMSSINDEDTTWKKNMLRKINVLKRQNFNKSVFGYIKDKHQKLSNPFDIHIELIGFTNGTYDLKSSTFRSACKTDYISLVVPYDYKTSSNEDVQFVLDYVSKIMPNKDERDLLLTILSTCTSGIVLDRFVVCTGLGSNGKDALFTFMLRAALGPLYYRANNTVITQKARTELNVGIANMNKRRASIFSETSTNTPIQCALIKELTGGNSISARSLYSTDTGVDLHHTMFMLCNEKPQLDKVDEAIARRLVTFQFRSSFKSKEYIVANGLTVGQKNVFLGDESVKSETFLNKYKLPFMNLLLSYYPRFRDAGYQLTNVPETIRNESQKYMQMSDPIYSWFESKYEKTDSKNDIIQLKDVFTELKHSEFYINMTKQDRRALTYASLVEYVGRSPLLRIFYEESNKIKVNGKYTTMRNYITNFLKIDSNSSLD